MVSRPPLRSRGTALISTVLAFQNYDMSVRANVPPRCVTVPPRVVCGCAALMMPLQVGSLAGAEDVAVRQHLANFTSLLWFFTLPRCVDR